MEKGKDYNSTKTHACCNYWSSFCLLKGGINKLIKLYIFFKEEESITSLLKKTKNAYHSLIMMWNSKEIFHWNCNPYSKDRHSLKIAPNDFFCCSNVYLLLVGAYWQKWLGSMKRIRIPVKTSGWFHLHC